MRTCPLSLLAVVVWLAPPGAAQVGPPQLLADIVAQTSADSRPREFVTAGPWTYFVADSSRHGTELFRTGGTPETTTLVKDLVDNGSSKPRSLVVDGGLLWFVATYWNSDCDTRVHSTDGTPGGTQTFPMAFPAAQIVRRVAGRTVAECFCGPVDRHEIRTSDGGGQWSRLLSDLIGTLIGHDMRFVSPTVETPEGPRVWFVSRGRVHGGPTASHLLWVTDGSRDGTRLIGELPAASTVVHTASPAPGLLIITTDAATNGLFVANTVTTTITAIPVAATPRSKPVIFDSRAVFIEGFGGDIVGVAVDATSATPIRMAGQESPTTVAFGVVGNSLYLASTGPTPALGRLDAGQNAASALRQIFPPNEPPQTPPIGGKIYYRSFQLIELDPISGDSRVVFPHPTGAIGSHFGRLVFAGDDPDIGIEPHVYTPSAGTTRALADLAVSAASFDSNPGSFARFGNFVVFDAFRPDIGREPWITDGTPQGTRLLGNLGFNPTNVRSWFWQIGSELWIGQQEVPNFNIWRSDGSTREAQRIATLPLAGIELAAPLAGWLLVSGSIGSQRGLFRIDRLGNVVHLQSMNPRYGSALSIRKMLTAGGRAFLASPTTPTGREYVVWTSDGTPAGTRAIAKLDDLVADMAVFRDRLWISARDGLFTWDGTELSRYADWAPSLLTVTREHLIGSNSTVIQVTDGMSGGVRILDVNMRTGRDGASQIFAVGDRLLYPSRSNWELLATDITLIEAIPLVPGAGIADRPVLLSPSQAVFGTMGNDPNGPRLYVTDGTREGTRPLADIRIRSESEFQTYWGGPTTVVANGRLFASLVDPLVGAEPFAMDLGAHLETFGETCKADPVGDVVFTADRVPGIGSTVTLYGRSPRSISAAWILGPPAAMPLRLPGSGCELHVELGGAAVLGPIAVDAAGAFERPLTIPNSSSLTGVRVATQALFLPRSPHAHLDVSAAIVLHVGR